MPASEAPRHTLAARLKPLLPPKWRIVPYQKNLDALSVTTLMIKQSAMRPLPAAPITLVQIDVTLTVISHLTDTARAEDELDDSVLALVVALDSEGIGWTEARKVLWDDRHLAYDIDIQLDAKKEEEQ